MSNGTRILAYAAEVSGCKALSVGTRRADSRVIAVIYVNLPRDGQRTSIAVVNGKGLLVRIPFISFIAWEIVFHIVARKPKFHARGRDMGSASQVGTGTLGIDPVKNARPKIKF
jgi:hypothetical protein